MSILEKNNSVDSHYLDLILTSMAHILKQLKGSNICVLGATGFVGSWLTSVLLNANNFFNLDLHLQIVTRKDLSYFKKIKEINFEKVKFIYCNLSDPLPNLEINADIYFHLATPSSIKSGFGDGQLIKSVTRTGTSLIIDQIKKSKKSFTQVINLSSGGIYAQAKSKTLPFTESRELVESSLASSYQNAKIEAEKNLIEASKQLSFNVQNLRLFTFYGPKLPLNEHFAIGNFMYQALTKNSIKIQAPNTIRSYMHIADLIRALLLVIGEPKNQTLNIGSSGELSMSELSEKFHEIFTEKSIKIFKDSNSGLQSYYVPDTTTFCKKFNFEEIINFQKGLLDWKNFLLRKN